MTQVFKTLEGIENERSDRGLISRIERLLQERKLEGTEDFQLLKWSIDSVIEPTVPKSMRKLESIHDPRFESICTPDPGPHDQACEEELSHRLRRAVDELPDDLRKLMHDVYWEGKSLADCGRELGKERNRVWDARKKAVRILAKQLTSVLAAYQD